MFNKTTLVRAIVGLAVTGIGASLANGQSRPRGPADLSNTLTGISQPSSPSASGPPEGQFATVYDMAPALARFTFAQAEMHRTQAQFMAALAAAREQFSHSPDLVAAKKNVDDARRALEAARQPVRQKLVDNSDYKNAVAFRDQIDASLQSKDLTPGVRQRIAIQKLQYINDIGRLESSAFDQSADVQSAKSRLQAAEQALTEKYDQFELSLTTLPAVAAAQQELDSARSNLAGASGYLSGAYITRADWQDADMRRYPASPSYGYGTGYNATGYGSNGVGYGPGYGFVAPPVSPYWSGYFGLPSFYVPSVTVVRF